MRIIFTILLFVVANNLFAQDSIEVKRIDSFIKANEKQKIIYDDVTTIVNDLESIGEHSFPRNQKIISVIKRTHKQNYHSVSFLYTSDADTTVKTSFFYKNKATIKVVSIIYYPSSYENGKKISEIYDSTSCYFNNEKLISCNKKLTKKSLRKNYKQAKSLLRKILRLKLAKIDFGKYEQISKEQIK